MIKKKIVSEYVSYGHPDKIADQIADCILDDIVKEDPDARAGIEVMVKDNVVVLGGEVHFNGMVDYESCVRSVFDDLNFPDLESNKIKIVNLIGQQSAEIHNGVDKDGDVNAGDQGFMVGFASNETKDFMPLGAYLARIICNAVVSEGYGPDAKSQVIVSYDENGNALSVDSILVSAMHEDSLNDIRMNVTNLIMENMVGIDEDIFERFFEKKHVKIDVNPCGEWRVGGPVSDCGVTGRKLVVDAYGGYCNIGGGAYCVDGDTEYIAEDLRWHKISEYSGGRIGQWNNGILEFVTPSHYHVNDAEKMYHFHNPTTIDMVLSENHDVVCRTSKGNLHKVKVNDVIEKINNNVDGFKDTIPCTFEWYGGNGINLTDDQIRLQVAFCADGSYSSVPGDKGRINIKKRKKIDRLEWLLKRTNTEYHLLDKGEYQNHYYTFIPPVPNNKSLYNIFKDADFRQLSIVAKEVLLWDGSDKSNIFRTTIKEDADFMQFVFSIVYNKRVSILKDDRVGEERVLSVNGKSYVNKSITYEVLIGKIKEISMMTKMDGTKINVDPFIADKMYCFTVDSGMLLLRRNDKIFVTGNCGKDLSKVDRSGAYIARYIAKNIVASGFSDTAKVTLSYMIGVAEPCSVDIELNRNNDEKHINALKTYIKEHVNLTPGGIIEFFDPTVPRYYMTSRNGHYGFYGDWRRPWEKLDIADDIKKLI